MFRIFEIFVLFVVLNFVGAFVPEFRKNIISGRAQSFRSSLITIRYEVGNRENGEYTYI